MVERCLGFRTWMAGLALAICGAARAGPGGRRLAARTAAAVATRRLRTSPIRCRNAPARLRCGRTSRSGSARRSWHSQATFQAHVNARGTSCGVAADADLADPDDRPRIHTYLVNVRNGIDRQLHAHLRRHGRRLVSRRCDLVHDHATIAARRWPIRSRRPVTTRSSSSHTATGAERSAATSPSRRPHRRAACTVNSHVRFTPTAAGTRSGSVTVNPTANSGIDYQSRIVLLLGRRLRADARLHRGPGDPHPDRPPRLERQRRRDDQQPGQRHRQPDPDLAAVQRHRPASSRARAAPASPAAAAWRRAAVAPSSSPTRLPRPARRTARSPSSTTRPAARTRSRSPRPARSR